MNKIFFCLFVTICLFGCSSGSGSETPGPIPDPDPDPIPAPGVEFQYPNAEKTDGITRAFPGAEGGGMYTTGGRGGKVYHVTKLTDDGSVGTLRHAVEQREARTVVFDVAGTIELRKPLKIESGNITVAGQTAPGDGICLKNYTFYIGADNVIVRYVRFRLGDGNQASADDAAWGRYNKNVILDHCSMSWSIDECASFYGNCNFTMQWCLITESLCKSGHPKGDHGYGGIWGGCDASFHHNLLSNHTNRLPRFDHPGVYDSSHPTSTYRGNVDFRNNLVYNWGSGECSYGGEQGTFNMVNNYYKPGPASKRLNYLIRPYKNTDASHQYTYPMLYLDGNIYEGASAINSDNWNGGVSLKQGGEVAELKLASPAKIGANCSTTTHTGADVLRQVAAYAGASLSRDAVDKRAADDALAGTASISSGGNGSTNGILDTPLAAGGWPELEATQEQLNRTKDTDGDGIPDYYETLFGLDETQAQDGAAKTLDSRYTNLEMYLHYLVQSICVAQVEGGVNVKH